jgi:hypothetical protein
MHIMFVEEVILQSQRNIGHVYLTMVFRGVCVLFVMLNGSLNLYIKQNTRKPSGMHDTIILY